MVLEYPNTALTDVLIDSRSLSVQIVGKKNIPTYYKMSGDALEWNKAGMLTAVPNGMVVQLCYTQSAGWADETDEAGNTVKVIQHGTRAAKFSLAISPVEAWGGGNPPAVTGSFVKEQLISATEQNVNNAALTPSQDPDGNPTEPAARPAQFADYDLECHVKDIYNKDIADQGTVAQYPVTIRAVAYDADNNILAVATAMHDRHSDTIDHYEIVDGTPVWRSAEENPPINPHVLTMSIRPSPPEIKEISPGDNKISLRFETKTAAGIPVSAQVKLLVQLSNTTDHAEAIISEHTVSAKEVAYDTQSDVYTVRCELEGRMVEGDETSDYKLVNGELYQIFASVADNNSVWSHMGPGVTVTPRNTPRGLRNEKVTTVFSSGLSEEVLLLSDVTFGETACVLTAEIPDLDVVNPAHIYWGVREVDLAGNELAGGFQGMSNNELRRAKKAWGEEERVGDMYKVTMNIPKSWFRNEHNGYDSHIQLQARVGQTTKHDADDTETELYGDLLGNHKSAYLVTSEEVVFNQTVGPLKNGIQVIERNASNGRQRFSVAGKGDSPTVTYSYPQKDGVDVSGSISIDSMSGDFVGSMAVGAGLTYENILNGTGYTDIDGPHAGGVLTFRATVDDPNDPHPSGVKKFATETTVPLYPFKYPTGDRIADIERGPVNTPPLCSCDISGLSANLNGWSLDSMQLKVFESADHTNIVVSHPELSLNSLDASFNANTGLAYNNWPGNYDCRYTANFSLANMAGASKTLYGGFMDEPIIVIEKSHEGKSNYYNDPVITSVSIIEGSMNIIGSTNGSTMKPEGYQSYGFVQEKDEFGIDLSGQYRLSVAQATGEVVTSDNWIFNTNIAHLEPLVKDPDPRVTVGEEIFDGFAVVNPDDAQSYFKLALK